MDNVERIDVLIAKTKNISREQAKEFILSEKVFLDGTKVLKASLKVPLDSQIEIKAETKYVGRGGYKLEKALQCFSVNVENRVCMDVGASTGGFTDCLLQNNAQKVYAIDVGHSQLAEKIAVNSKVISMEKTNIKNVTPESLEPMDFVCVDVSFISLTKILLPIYMLMKDDADIICLVKPQFEAGKGNLNKSGIVKNPKIHLQVLHNITQYVMDIGFGVQAITFSGIKGTDGNIEYLLHLKKEVDAEENRVSLKGLVQEAFEKLKTCV